MQGRIQYTLLQLVHKFFSFDMMEYLIFFIATLFA
jgi:hypothetical protein